MVIPTRRPRHIEDDHQAALFRWAAMAERQHPDLCMLAAMPLGGKRNAREAARLKGQGAKAGYPDILLDAPRGRYHGLRIELKAPRETLGRKPTVSATQKDWITRLNDRGYCALVCEGWEAARKAILLYLTYPTITGA